MPDEILLCPKCNRKLRMVESHQGQLVQCPFCGVAFWAPARPAAGLPGAPGEEIKPPGPIAAPEVSAPAVQRPAQRPVVEPAEPADAEQPAIDVHRVLLLPGMALLISGVLGLLLSVNLLREMWTWGPEVVLQERMPRWASALGGKSVAPAEFARQAIVFAVITILLSLVTVVGAVQMLRVQSYWLAVAGSVLACVNCSSCLLTAPIGIWSLLVLRLPEVRGAFAAPPAEGPQEPKDEANDE